MMNRFPSEFFDSVDLDWSVLPTMLFISALLSFCLSNMTIGSIWSLLVDRAYQKDR